MFYYKMTTHVFASSPEEAVKIVVARIAEKNVNYVLDGDAEVELVDTCQYYVKQCYWSDDFSF